MLKRISLSLIGVMLLLQAFGLASDREGQVSSDVKQAAAADRVTEHFARIRQDPPALRAFLRAFPKGADLHSHLSGAIYAENYIQWAADLPCASTCPV
jgi:hypothetical protein